MEGFSYRKASSAILRGKGEIMENRFLNYRDEPRTSVWSIAAKGVIVAVILIVLISLAY